MGRRKKNVFATGASPLFDIGLGVATGGAAGGGKAILGGMGVPTGMMGMMGGGAAAPNMFAEAAGPDAFSGAQDDMMKRALLRRGMGV